MIASDVGQAAANASSLIDDDIRVLRAVLVKYFSHRRHWPLCHMLC